MSLEALWSVEFRSNLGNLGGGVVMFKTGRVLGGDGSFYFLGDFFGEGRNRIRQGRNYPVQSTVAIGVWRELSAVRLNICRPDR